MKTILYSAALFCMTFGAAQAQSEWNFDKSHSKIRFAVDHMVISETEGRFEDFTGKVVASKEDFSDADINFTIQVGSINTDDPKRDEHLKAPDFFDAAKYPTISFKGKGLKKSGKGYQLTGDLTMHGQTKPVTLNVEYGGTVNDPWGNTKAGFKLSGELNRKDWGLTYNSVMDSGGLMIGEEVSITCNVELVKKKA